MKIIRNGVVKMDWDAEGFFESKNDGFVAAVHIYNTEEGSVAVCFMDRRAFVLLDVDTRKPCTREELYEAVKYVHNNSLTMEDAFQEDYVELLVGVEPIREVAFEFGLSEDDCDDMGKRGADLFVYYTKEDDDF